MKTEKTRSFNKIVKKYATHWKNNGLDRHYFNFNSFPDSKIYIDNNKGEFVVENANEIEVRNKLADLSELELEWRTCNDRIERLTISEKIETLLKAM